MKEVKMPPLDGTPFVSVWVCGSIICSGMYRVCDNVILEYSNDEDDYIYDSERVHYQWEDDLDARYFIAE